MKTLVPLFLLALVLVFAGSLQAQQADHPGVALYKQGKYSEAVNILSLAVKDNKWKTNGLLWNYLGLAYIGVDDYKKAKKAIQKAVDLEPGNSAYHTNLAYIYLVTGVHPKAISEADKALSIDHGSPSALYVHGSAYLSLLKLDQAEKDADQMMASNVADGRGYVLAASVKLARLQQLLSADQDASLRENLTYVIDARDILRNGVDAARTPADKKLVNDELELLEPFYQYFTKEPVKPGAPPDPNVTPLFLISKPRAQYTDQARSNGVSGTVVVAVLFGADGKIDGVMLLRKLGYGLDQNALRAARAITFKPKQVNGTPVSVVRLVEYNFNIY